MRRKVPQEVPGAGNCMCVHRTVVIRLAMFLPQILSLLSLGPLSYGFVLLSSPAAAGAGNPNARDAIFQVGNAWSYDLETTVLLNAVRHGKNVGFQVEAAVDVASVWQNPAKTDSRLLKLELISPKLNIKSRKAPAPEGFVAHSSHLDTYPSSPFYVLWTSGVIEKFFALENEPVSLVNFKKGIASLFQFQILDMNTVESDASGNCDVTYSSLGPHEFRKTKTHCRGAGDVPFIDHPDRILSNIVTSDRTAVYKLNFANNGVDAIETDEFHEMKVTIRQDAGSNVRSVSKLYLNPEKKVTVASYEEPTLGQVLRTIEQTSGGKLAEDNLITKREAPMCQTDACPSLARLVSENKEQLKDDKLGTIKSANAFIRLVMAARRSNRDEFVRILKHERNKDMLFQLYDLVGFTQTEAAHQAAMKVLNLNDDSDLDYAERYFWALSMGSHPTAIVIQDVLKILQKDTVKNDKLLETITLSIAAMANRFRRLPENEHHLKIVLSVKEVLENGLDYCKAEECILRHLRALKNLQHESTIPKLLEYALKGDRKPSVAAMKALRTFDARFWNDDVLSACHKIFFQTSKPFDSSARTLGLDIILESRPSPRTLQHIIHFLLSNDGAYEVKQYLLQRLRMISDTDGTFRTVVNEIVRNETRINNYAVLGQRGLSTAFYRSFSENPSNNGSLVTIQEINGGILKRGIVNVVLENGGVSQEMFSLGLFAGGLSSFVSSDDGNGVDPAAEPEEPANAGMEVTVLGVQIRPFTFFSGQGELMGHVWSGTASEKTPAYQAIILLHDHLQYIRLAAGFVAELNLLGSTSFDLSGEIQMSLWNRNAHSLVEKNAGIVVVGVLRVDSDFVRSQVEFNLSTEPRLNLVSDIDFYSGVSLCMQLKQPDTVFKHNIYKVERIPGSKHRLRRSIYKVLKVPGKTYALNRKNNEMCNIIFKNDN